MEMIYPIKGENFKSTSQFGLRQGTKHKGIDLKGDSGDIVLAALPGEVTKSDDTSDPSGYGGQVMIRHEIDGKIFFTRYAHLRKRFVQPFQKVKQGDEIGEVGGGKNDPNKGRATGPHLHFEVLDGNQPLDPEPYLKGAMVLGGVASAAALAGGKEDKSNGTNSKNDNDDESDIVDDIIDTFSKAYIPVASLAALPGLSQPQKETKLSKPILEDIERIKELLK